MSFLEKLAALLPADQPDQPLEVKPGYNAVLGKTIRLKIRVYRAAEDRWYDVPDEVSGVDGDPR